MRSELLLALALAAGAIVAVLPLCALALHSTSLPRLDARSPGLEYLRPLIRRAANLRLMTGRLSVVIAVAIFGVMWLLGRLGSDCLQAGPLGAAGPWLVCFAATIPVGSYLAAGNDAREAWSLCQSPSAEAPSSSGEVTFQDPRFAAILDTLNGQMFASAYAKRANDRPKG